MRAWLTRLLGVVLAVVVVSLATIVPAGAIPGFPDCKDAPVPEVPGRGIAGFFDGMPAELPPDEDPFAEDAKTTIYEQYGYAGYRWNTYDLGCGPDAMRHPDAVLGTTVSNWLLQLPLALTALTGSITELAFKPELLAGLDGAVSGVTRALHENFFASWIPFVLALIGALVIFKARKASLATSAAAVGWALIVVLVATALFRWPLEAGRAADATVTSTLGAVVSELDGNGSDIDPGTAVASNINESILYRAWLAGTVGSPDSKTAKKYGPTLFKAHAYSWREVAEFQGDAEAGSRIIEAKQKSWAETAELIRQEDPEAYEHLTGLRSETRVGYAVLSTLGVFLALPFLLMSALLLLGCFLIVRLGVMLFPAFATLGAFPAARSLVTGLARTVGAALVNATIFGIGAGITVAVLGLLFRPGNGTPAWFGLVLMPLFSAIMWVALKPFRRLTSMVSTNSDFMPRFQTSGWLKRTALTGLAAATGGATAGAATAAMTEEDPAQTAPPERAESRPATYATARPVPALGAASVGASGAGPSTSPDPRPGGPGGPVSPAPRHRGEPQEAPALEPGFVPRPREESLEPAGPEEFDGEDVFVIYRPEDDEATV